MSIFQDESRLLAPPPVQPEREPATRRRSPACASSPTRHPGRWLATAVVAVLLAMVVSSLVTNDRWQWSVVTQYLTWPSVLDRRCGGRCASRSPPPSSASGWAPCSP